MASAESSAPPPAPGEKEASAVVYKQKHWLLKPSASITALPQLRWEGHGLELP